MQLPDEKAWAQQCFGQPDSKATDTDSLQPHVALPPTVTLLAAITPVRLAPSEMFHRCLECLCKRKPARGFAEQ